MGYRSLRVINDDIVSAGAGFPTHGHKDMEIITYVLRGALAHKDSTGAEGVLVRGDIQAMTAGTGVRHSEFNPSTDQDLRLLQIWIMPEQDGLAPAYRQASVTDEAKTNQLRLIAAHKGQEGALAIHQDARIYASILDAGKTVAYDLAQGRGAWLQLADGDLSVNGQVMKSGDGIAIEDITKIFIVAQVRSEFLLFDLD